MNTRISTKSAETGNYSILMTLIEIERLFSDTLDEILIVPEYHILCDASSDWSRESRDRGRQNVVSPWE